MLSSKVSTVNRIIKALNTKKRAVLTAPTVLDGNSEPLSENTKTQLSTTTLYYNITWPFLKLFI